MGVILVVFQIERIAVLPFGLIGSLGALFAQVSCFLSLWGHRVIDNGLGSIRTCIFLIILHSMTKTVPFPFPPYLLKLQFLFFFFARTVR